MKKKHALFLLHTALIAVLCGGAFSLSTQTVSAHNGIDHTKEAAVSTADQCPLTGKTYPSSIRKAWQKTRPLAIMLDNHPEARPQSGLFAADVVFEAMSEGGATFYMPIFYCEAQGKDITVAPVRSARAYFIDWAAGFHAPFYVHVGGTNLAGPADALGKIKTLGWENHTDMNQFSLGYPVFTRNYERIPGKQIPTEYTMETSTKKLWKAAEKRSVTISDSVKTSWPEGYMGWSFEDVPNLNLPPESTIHYEFWDGFAQSAVDWKYDETSHTYQRFMADGQLNDLETKKPVQASNVIILFTQEQGPIDEQKHLLYETIGEGKVLVYHDGGVEVGTWKKEATDKGLFFLGQDGHPLKLTRGMTWISVLSTDRMQTGGFKKYFPLPTPEVDQGEVHVNGTAQAQPKISFWQRIKNFFSRK